MRGTRSAICYIAASVSVVACSNRSLFFENKKVVVRSEQKDEFLLASKDGSPFPKKFVSVPEAHEWVRTGRYTVVSQLADVLNGALLGGLMGGTVGTTPGDKLGTGGFFNPASPQIGRRIRLISNPAGGSIFQHGQDTLLQTTADFYASAEVLDDSEVRKSGYLPFLLKTGADSEYISQDGETILVFNCKMVPIPAAQLRRTRHHSF